MTPRRADAGGAPLLLAAMLAVVAAPSLGCEPSDPTPVGRGARVFQRSCSGCHGADGRGVLRLGLTKPPRDLTNPEFHAQVTDEQLRRVIRVGKNQMPAFGGLMGDEDLSNVIAFIRTLPPGARTPAASSPASSPPGSSPPASSPAAESPPASSPPAESPPAESPPVTAPPAPPSARVAPSGSSNRDGVLQ